MFDGGVLARYLHLRKRRRGVKRQRERERGLIWGVRFGRS